jgi:hypothetical protein
VGSNVMCIMIRREHAIERPMGFTSGMIPAKETSRSEASYFRWPRDSIADWIFLPASLSESVYYGPNYSFDGRVIRGLRFGPTEEVMPIQR